MTLHRRSDNQAPAVVQEMTIARPISLVEQIVEAIVKAASEGAFRPGERLSENDIARRLHVSRVPIREALRILESQGIADRTITGRGLVLMPVDANRLHQILVVRNSLEQLAGQEAAKVRDGDPQVFAKMEVALREMERATLDDDGYAHARADLKFHRGLCEISRNEVLMQIWDGLSRRLTIIFGLATLQKGLLSIYREHVELLDLLRRGEPAAIAANIQRHIIEMTEALDFDLLVAGRRPAAEVRPPASR